MRNWKLVSQTETENFEKVDVLVKRIRHFPVQDSITGEKSFRPISKHLFILQVVVESDGDQHRLKLIENCSRVKYVWLQPDRFEHPKLKIGLGKTGNRHTDTQREIVDTLAPKQCVPGDKAEFTSEADFVSHLNRILGSELANAVMELFRMRMQAL